MKNEPKCPYCGAIMSFEADSCHVWMKCPFCLSDAPKVEKPDVPNADFSAIGWAIYWSKCEEIAKKAAMYRPDRVLLPLLTLKELRALIDAGKEAVIYCETKYDPQTYATIIYDGKMFDRYGKTTGVKHMNFGTYGKTWRAWATRPTEEERAAAPWEE